MANKLLIVDDEPDVLRLTEFFLKKKGYEVLMATNGEVAITIAKENRPNLVLLDIKMPKMDGYEVFKRIRRDENLTKIPIVFMTADASTHVSENTEYLGAEGYLLKPFEMTALLNKIKQYIF